MEPVYKNLGKVTLTCNDGWDITRAYDRLSVVSHNGMSFISKQDVSAGVDILDTDYWQQFGAMRDIINNPDEEDITEINNKLMFKNRIPNTTDYIDYGSIYLRRNIVNGKNVIEHSMLTEMYTTYIISYTFDVNGATLYIPEGCTLDFQGGKIVGNGKVVFSNTKFDGILKLSDGFADSIVLEGTYEEGQVLMVEDRLKYWKDSKWNNVADDTNFTVKSTETLPAGQPAEVILTTVEDVTAFSFKIPRGLTGERGAPGINGESILSSRTIFAFKVSTAQPASPVGGSWNSVTDVVTYPVGWSANDSSAGIMWMSTAIFGTTGIRGAWSTPIRITGNDGKNGEDGNSVEFIYKLTKDSSIKPGKPVSQNVNDHIPLGWTDNPVGINLTNKVEWICTREKDTVWGEWSEPALWSKYGVDGRDGDGVEYIFKLTSAAIPPERPTSVEQTTDFIPVGWTDNPVGVSIINNYEWVSVRKFRNNLWGSFSNPALWAKYGKNGSDGVDGLSVRMMYAKTTDSSTPPHFVNNNINPGSTWALAIPNYSGNEAIWAIQGTVTTSNTLVGIWQGPYLMTGVNGKDGIPVNYKTYVYKLSETKPNKPVSNDPVNPGNSWIDYPNTAGNWWQCIGSVNGYTDLVISWGEVIPLNGRDGTAQDGKFTEFRFAKSSNATAPAINVSLRTPAGWTKDFPAISGAETLWMTKAEINPDDTLLGTWSQPVRISGEKGPQGNTGPAGEPGSIGSQGPSGVPGIDIELRFSLGSDAVQDAIWSEAVKRNREPSSSGWLKVMPTVTEAKPYIWMIQSRITRVNPSDPGVLESGNWSDPIRLNGANGLPGAIGKKGQLIYPAGVYGNNVRYTTTELKAPYVYDPSDGNFYVLNSIMSWLGTEQFNKTPSQDFITNSGKYWLKFDAFEAIYAKIGIIANGLIGSVVFNGDYMFSQNGITPGGIDSTSYELFDPTDPSGGVFIPNICLNFKKGEGWLGNLNFSSRAGTVSSEQILSLNRDHWAIDDPTLQLNNHDISADAMGINFGGKIISGGSSAIGFQATLGRISKFTIVSRHWLLATDTDMLDKLPIGTVYLDESDHTLKVKY